MSMCFFALVGRRPGLRRCMRDARAGASVIAPDRGGPRQASLAFSQSSSFYI